MTKIKFNTKNLPTMPKKEKATRHEEIIFQRVYKGFEVMELLLNGKDVFIPQWMYIVNPSEVEKHV